jgi:mRNA interferase MazF
VSGRPTSRQRKSHVRGRLPLAPYVALLAAVTGLPKDSVANVSQIVAIDRDLLTERVGRLPDAHLRRIIAGIDLVLGRE